MEKGFSQDKAQGRIAGTTPSGIAYYLKLYAASFAAFLAIDMVWLGFVANSFYQEYLGYLMAENPNWLAAGIFYLLFVTGILYFAVVPGLKERSLKGTLLRGALFGLITYATYDLTNLATVQGWPILVTVIDMAWGTLLSVSVSFVSYQAGKRLK